MSVSSKLALVVAGVTAACAVVALGLGLTWVAEERRAEFRETHRRSFELLALAVAPSMPVGDHHAVQAAVDNIANFPERYPAVLALEILDREGRVVADLDPRRFGAVRRADVNPQDAHLAADLVRHGSAVRDLGEGRAQVVVPIELQYPLGVLRVTLDESGLLASITRYRRIGLLAALLLAVVLAGTISALLRRLVGRRIQRLAHAAARLGAGESPRAVRAEERGGDEIGHLGRLFNRMAATIATYTEGLESLVAQRTQALEAANARLATLATTDPLTGLHNRRYFDDHLRQLLELGRRGGRPVALAIIDVDHFKRVNDTWGHAVGDIVLVDVADVLRANARASDMVARLGGEEFAVVMPDTGPDAALRALERLREAIEAAPHPEAPEMGGRSITASVGVAVFPDDGGGPDVLLTTADRALYAAKAAGRNRVVRLADTGIHLEHAVQ